MSIQEALSSGTALLVVKADDLKNWHKQVIEDTRKELEESIKKESNEEYFTAAQVCKIFSVCRMTVQSWKNRGYLVPAMVGGKCLYKKSDIDALLNKRR